MQNNFKKHLWRCGFVTQFGSAVVLDKPKIMAYLHCSRRTLDRWINGDIVCPRALKLLEQYEKQIPDSWSGFYFDRMSRLHWPGIKNGFEAADVRRLPQFHARMARGESESENLTSLLDEIRDPTAHQLALEKLTCAINQLHQVSQEPIFKRVNSRTRLSVS